VTEPGRSAEYLAYRAAAAAILGRHDGIAAVAAFGLADVFAGDDLSPAYAFLEAQGRAGATTPALALLGLAGDLPPRATSVLLASALDRPGLLAVPGLVNGAVVGADRPGAGLVALDQVAAIRARPRPVADDYLTVLDVARTPAETLIPEARFAGLRAGSRARTRLGASAEILGVVDRLLEDAVAYAGQRRQFGHSLGHHQAVQHLLAWAATERHQLACLYDVAVAQAVCGRADPEVCRAVKAMSGRVFHAVVQAATQVTGAISFTWEYSLNRLHHRGLALDQLAGSSAALITEIGRQVRCTGTVPAFAGLYEAPV
jgi:hypothetical protein